MRSAYLSRLKITSVVHERKFTFEGEPFYDLKEIIFDNGDRLVFDAVETVDGGLAVRATTKYDLSKVKGEVTTSLRSMKCLTCGGVIKSGATYYKYKGRGGSCLNHHWGKR